MKKTIFIYLLPFAVFLFPSIVSAQSRLTYPIPDLGYCRDTKECSLYCQIPENKAPCWSYGKYKLGSDVLGVSTMSEEEKRQMQQKAKQYNVVFPIADLGGCAGPQECRDFCEQPTNEQACMDFAKKKGFQKEVNSGTGLDRQKKDELLIKAQSELGCTSMESCSKICETDHTRCEAFTRKHGVYQEPSESRGRYSAEEKVQLMQKAQSELGCTSMESCKSTCEKNPQACMAFTKKHGFDRPEPREGAEKMERREEMETDSRRPGPMTGKCDSEDSCKKYCQEHPDECPGFQNSGRDSGRSTSQQQSPGIQSVEDSTNYVGPSGCRNETECKNWCETNPDKCPGFGQAKTQEESSKREYELRKKQMEQNQETEKRQFENVRERTQQNYEHRPSSSDSQGSGGGTPSYPSTSTQPAVPIPTP